MGNLNDLSKSISSQHLSDASMGLNKYLTEKDEYEKNLYIRMLCVIAQYESPLEETQATYLQKMIEDCRLENKLEDCLREALCFDMEEFKTFLEIFKEDILRFYFSIDSLILLSLGQISKKKQNLLADVFCSLRITENELQFLSKVSRSVVEQNSQLFDEAKECMPDSIVYLDCGFYVKDFYSGMLKDEDAYHFYSSQLTELIEEDIPSYMKYKKLGSNAIWIGFQSEHESKDSNFVFENKVIHSVSYESFSFLNCKLVQFVNCVIYICAGFSFDNCKEVSFVNCSIICYERAIYLGGVNTFRCLDCTITAFRGTESIAVNLFLDIWNGACDREEVRECGLNGGYDIQLYNAQGGIQLIDNDFPFACQGIHIKCHGYTYNIMRNNNIRGTNN